MLCSFASSLTNAQYMWGPNESQRLEMEKKTKLAISALLLLATAFSAASSSLSAWLMACLMSSISRVPVGNCWWGAAGQIAAAGVTSQQTHTPTLPQPSCLGAGRAAFLNSICISVFLNCISVLPHTKTKTHRHHSQLSKGRQAWIFHPCSAFTSRIKFTLTRKNTSIHPWHVFSTLLFAVGGKEGGDFWSNIVNKHKLLVMQTI